MKNLFLFFTTLIASSYVHAFNNEYVCGTKLSTNSVAKKLESLCIDKKVQTHGENDLFLSIKINNVTTLWQVVQAEEVNSFAITEITKLTIEYRNLTGRVDPSNRAREEVHLIRRYNSGLRRMDILVKGHIGGVEISASDFTSI